MWALGLYDLLTPGDLTRGRTIAGTGAIDLEGNIGPIGGAADKVVAAQSVDADILLVPQGNFDGAPRRGHRRSPGDPRLDLRRGGRPRSTHRYATA